MECPGCHFEIPAYSKFCLECGCRLQEAESACGVSATEGERKHVTIMFSDLSGYTAMTERLDPEEVKETMSTLFCEMTRIICRYGGFVERFIGDAVMAVFGVPKAHEDDPIRAIKSAIEIHSVVESFNPDFQNKIGRPLTMHTGINTGLVVTGEVDVLKGTHGLTGDAINLASRLEGLAKAGEIWIGEDTYRQAKGQFSFKKLEPVRVKGHCNIPHLKGLAEGYLRAVEVYEEEKRAEWLQKAGKACRELLKYGKIHRSCIPPAMRLKGIYEWLNNKPAAAKRWWRKSLRFAEEKELRYEEAETLLEMGRRLKIQEHVALAEKIFDEMGIVSDLTSGR